MSRENRIAERAGRGFVAVAIGLLGLGTSTLMKPSKQAGAIGDFALIGCLVGSALIVGIGGWLYVTAQIAANRLPAVRPVALPIQENQKTEPRPYDPAKRTLAFVRLALGLAGFCASAGTAGGKNSGGSLIAGLLNPLFSLGVPIGIWLLNRAYGNPNLVPCEDCGRRVSPSATACPGCGKPLEPLT